MSDHIEARDVALYVDGSLSADRLALIEAHIAACVRCHRVVRVVAAAERAGLVAVDLSEGSSDDLLALLSQPSHRWPSMIREARFQSPRIARRLVELAVEQLRDDPARSNDLAACATDICERLDVRNTADLQIDARKNRSTALRMMGRYTEALAELDRAADALSYSVDVDMQGAILALARAIILADIDVWQPEGAALLLSDAHRVFVARNATDRVLQADSVRAMLLMRKGDYREAHDAFDAMVRLTADGNFLHDEASVNLGLACVEVGDLERAEHIGVALLRHPAASIRVRAQVVRARVLYARGDVSEAIREYIEAMGAMFAAGDDAALRVGLEAAEWYMVAGDGSAAYSLLKQLAVRSAELDRAVPSRRRCVTAQALQYLAELASDDAVTFDAVGAVKSYLRDLRGEAMQSFVPPMPNRLM